MCKMTIEYDGSSVLLAAARRANCTVLPRRNNWHARAGQWRSMTWQSTFYYYKVCSGDTCKGQKKEYSGDYTLRAWLMHWGLPSIWDHKMILVGSMLIHKELEQRRGSSLRE
jgi:hypothetical protein